MSSIRFTADSVINTHHSKQCHENLQQYHQYASQQRGPKRNTLQGENLGTVLLHLHTELVSSYLSLSPCDMNGIHSIKVFNLCRGGGRSFLAVSVRAKSCTNCTAHTHQPVQREMIYNSIAKTDIIMQAMTTYKTCTDGKYFPHCFIPSALFSPDTVTSCSTRQSGAFPSPSSPASPAPGLTHWSEGCSELQHSAAEYDYSCRSIIP